MNFLFTFVINFPISVYSNASIYGSFGLLAVSGVIFLILYCHRKVFEAGDMQAIDNRLIH